MLGTPCRICGFANLPDDRFCGGCGGELPTGSSEDGERRQVAVLFADLSDYTRLSSILDPEEIHRLLQRFFDVTDGIVTRFGGSVDKHIGDNVMALFGAPVAHHDDCERAVRAADTIHREVGDLANEIGIALAVHIGIAVGEVMASGTGSRHHHHYTVIGTSVNLAARLEKVAQPGQTLVSGAVQRATAAVAEFESLGDIDVKGFDGQVPVFRFAGLRDARARVGPVFIGRRTELDRAADVLGRAKGGEGAVLYVRGQAGIGKTRLVAEIEQLAVGLGFGCHIGRVVDFGAVRGHGAVEALVTGLLGAAPTATAEERAAALACDVGQELVTPEHLPFVRDLLDLPQVAADRAMYEAMDPSARQRGRHEAVRSLVRRATTRRPRLLVVEDIHWASRSTLDHLAALADDTGRRVLILTSRIESDPLDATWRSAATADLSFMDLPPLTADEAWLLATRIVPRLDERARRRVDRAGGNPLFLEQLLLDSDDREEAIPGTVQSLILARMDRLPPGDRTALQAASVAGEWFTAQLVQHLIGDRTYDCRALVSHYLVEPQPNGFRFHHALVQEGVYSSLTHIRKRELHHSAAVFYGDENPVLHALHLDRAEDPTAPQAYLAAGRARMAAYDFDLAAELFERGLALSAAGDAWPLATALGELHLQVGDGQRSVAAHRRGLDSAGSEIERCRSLIGIAAGFRLSSYPAALEVLAEALPIAQKFELSLELAQINYYQGSVYFSLGDAARCEASHASALANAEKLEVPEWKARALSGLGDAAYARGDVAAALDQFQAAVRLCEAHGFEQYLNVNRFVLAHCFIFVRLGFADARQMMEDALASARRLGASGTECVGLVRYAFIHILAGVYEGMDDLLRGALERLRRLGMLRFEAEVLAMLAAVDRQAGQLDSARQLARQAVESARRNGFDFSGPMTMGMLALVADAEERAQVIADGRAVVRGNALAHNWVFFYQWGIDAVLESGDLELARIMTDELESFIVRPDTVAYAALLVERARLFLAPAGETRTRHAAALLARAAAHGMRITVPD